jgi:drug/metabolite transporter (DMT)-like permease
LVATGLVRPTITAALVAAIAVAYLMRRNPRPSTELTPLVRALGLAVILVGVYTAAHQAASFVGASSIDASNVDAAFSSAGAHTAEGGSSFQATVVRSPVDFPRAAVTVLFRPFLTEAHNGQMLIAAAEGTLLLGLFAFSWRRLSTVPRRLRQQPYLIVCLAYAAIFVYGFSYFANFGILTRERVQVLPFVLVFLALPHPTVLIAETASPRPMRAAT